jgi:hypothetical protein
MSSAGDGRCSAQDYPQWRGVNRRGGPSQSRAPVWVARASRTALEPLKRYTVADSATWSQPAILDTAFIKDLSSLWSVE